MGRGVVCDRCGEAFADASVLALHRGRVHEASLSGGERALFEAARSEEEAWLASFRAHALGALAALVIVLSYVVVVLPAYLLRGNPAMLLLPIPGIAIFSVVTYWGVYTHRKQVEERRAA